MQRIRIRANRIDEGWPRTHKRQAVGRGVIVVPLAKLATSCRAWSLTESSSDRGRDGGWTVASFPFNFVGERLEYRVLTMGSRTPRPIHASFFCTWPTISFLRACRAAVCSGSDFAFRSCARIGEFCGRAMGAVQRNGATIDVALVCWRIGITRERISVTPDSQGPTRVSCASLWRIIDRYSKMMVSSAVSMASEKSMSGEQSCESTT